MTLRSVLLVPLVVAIDAAVRVVKWLDDRNLALHVDDLEPFALPFPCCWHCADADHGGHLIACVGCTEDDEATQ